MSYWIKLYTELLDDPKIGPLPNYLWRRWVEFLLCAKENDRAGLLQPVVQLAWRLRTTVEECEEALRALSEIGVVAETPDGWLVVSFERRQAAMTAAQRKRWERDKKRVRLRHDNVTNRDKKCHEAVTKNGTEEEEELELEVEVVGPGLQKTPPDNGQGSFSAATTAVAMSAWGSDDRQAEALYQRITQQISLPASQIASALPMLHDLLAHYGNDLDKAVEAGRPVFARWCMTVGKNGRLYSPVNTGWLEKWLEALAPRPEVAGAAEGDLAARVARDAAKVRSLQ